MLVYGNEESVYAWNAVDVLVDGHLQHGDVINVAHNGLIIDFRCAAQRAIFIEYGRIFHCKSNIEIPRREVQVLLPRRPDFAWMWYAGSRVEDVALDYAECVEVPGPQGTDKELLPRYHVRPVPSAEDLEQWRVGPGDFVVRSCRLDVPHWEGVSQRGAAIFRCELLRQYRALYISVENQTLNYLQRQDDRYPVSSESAHLIYMLVRRANKSGDEDLPLGWQQGLGSVAISSEPRPNKKRKILESGLPLPVELLVEVYQSLDSIDRVRCRRVCWLWNGILTTESYFRDVRVSGDHADYDGMYFTDRGVYWPAACLLKCLDSTINTVVLRKFDASNCQQLAEFIAHIRQAFRRLPLLVLSECDLGQSFGWAESVISDAAQLAVDGCCVRMVWRKCRLCDSLLQAVVSQHAFSVQSQEQLEVEMWDLLESSLILQQPLDRPAVAQMIADCVAHQRNDDNIALILQVLRDYQSADPRSSTPYRDQKWTASTLARVDAAQLTSLTAALIKKRRWQLAV